MAEEIVTIKGTRNGVALSIGEGDWPDVINGIETRLRATSTFFRGARVLMDVGPRALGSSEIQQVAQLLKDYQMSLASVISTNPETQGAARETGYALPVSVPPKTESEKSSLPFVEGILLHRTLRSGQVAKHEGHVAIIGDVNAGAHVIAGGDVIIWGKVRGIVHAGALGDEGAVVCALYLVPTQLRIGPYIARPPEERNNRPRAPEKAFVRDGVIVVEPWRLRD